VNERWKRDPGTALIVDRFNRPEKSDWSLLTAKETDFLYAEIKRCHDFGFVYTARNYFWIVDKDQQDVPFSLWESQELVFAELQRLKRLGRPQRLYILKSRQLGCSTLIDALIAYNCMFKPNRTAIIVSYNKPHTEMLFGKVSHIYDKLPWWLRPMLYTRKYDEGLIFDNPDKDQRTANPGLNSRIVIQPSGAYGGVGQGYTISDCHLSELSDFDQGKAQEIVEGDLRWALTSNPDGIQVIETTGKGAGTYTESLWQAQYELLDLATWRPLFLGWFFEKRNTREPEPHWEPPAEEAAMRKRIEEEWVSCNNCGFMRQMALRLDSDEGRECGECGKGKYQPYVLSDAQLRWYWQERLNAESKKDPEAIKTFRQEVSATAEDAFQSFGYDVFPASAVNWVNQTVRSTPLAIGNLDTTGRLHAVKDRKTGACYQPDCTQNHEMSLDQPLRIWELPQPGAKYAMGVDVAEGVGQDYAVIWINKLGGSAGIPDEHVATYRSSSVTPWFLADVANLLGKWYNTALACVEYNIPTTGDRLRLFHQYPNIFRWKHPDAEKIFSSRFHFVTRVNSKQWIIDTAIGWLQQHAWLVRDPVFAHEMKYFHREDFSSKKTGAAAGEHDDTIIAGAICLYCSHDTDIRDLSAPVVLPVESGLTQWKQWQMKCLKCGREFAADNPRQVERCPNCRSIMLQGHKNERPLEGFDPEEFRRLPLVKQVVAADTPWTEY
jgi:DNA-directed RNA polymerase subunit RPC12/RpoP